MLLEEGDADQDFAMPEGATGTAVIMPEAEKVRASGHALDTRQACARCRNPFYPNQKSGLLQAKQHGNTQLGKLYDEEEISKWARQFNQAAAGVSARQAFSRSFYVGTPYQFLRQGIYCQRENCSITKQYLYKYNLV